MCTIFCFIDISSFFTDSSWCAAPIFDLRSQHLQVDLLSIHAVSAVSTQGAVTENSWVSSYLVHYNGLDNDWFVLTDKGGNIKVCFSTVHILRSVLQRFMFCKSYS